MNKHLSDVLLRECEQHRSGGIYEATQIQFAWNSNHMEGSTLTPEQAAQLFHHPQLETLPGAHVSRDDVLEMRNHFAAFRYVLRTVDQTVDKTYVCTLHRMLKECTSQARDPRYNVGGYKLHPNMISRGLTPVIVAAPKAVPGLMEEFISRCQALTDNPLSIASMHWLFERIHPFSDGNGRVGRLVLFKELLRINALPMIIHDGLHDRYTMALSKFVREPGYLVDLLLYERDLYLAQLLEPAGMGLDSARVSYRYHDSWQESELPEIISANTALAARIEKR
ncbi:MAG: Fic family protein [Aeriscardovia aeriphila]|nr:Fic family protein [Aeriscardovia aeriphila]